MTQRDGLKPLSELTKPDIRNSFFVRIDTATGAGREITLEDHYATIEQYALHSDVPDDVATQYDVARNLYLYAWFEYRFYNVAEAQVLTALEFAMKRRIGEKNLDDYIKKRGQEHFERTGKRLRLPRGMRTLIEYCRDHGLISNDGFSAWHHRREQLADQLAMQAAIARIKETGEKEVTVDSREYLDGVTEEHYNHVQHLVEHVHKIRNVYAHGSNALHKSVTRNFEMVSQFINQIYCTDHKKNKQ